MTRPTTRPPGRPDRPYSSELQHERTALAWERAAFSMMGLGIVLARFAATRGLHLIAFAGLLFVGLGVGLILWASIHYEDRHDALLRNEDIANPSAARFVGIATTIGCLLCFAAALLATV